MLPDTRYARLRGERIAYQVMGDGPRDLVLTTGSFSNSDVEWEDTTMARLLMRLASFARVIRFDRRGTGASDPVPIQALPPWESYVEELVAVMDTVGSEVATVMAVFDAGPLGMVFAATKPERTAGLILANTAARFLWAADDQFGTPREVADQLIDQITERWGTEELVWIAVPSRAADARYRRWHARLQRSMASPGAVEAYLRALFDMDAREILGSIDAPTLVLHRKELALVPLEQGRYLAQHIPDATLVELEGSDLSLVHQGGDELVGRIEEFMTGERRGGRADRVLATVLFTDIVGSTMLAGRLGDQRWRERLEAHDELSRWSVERFEGRLVKLTGDGIMATFDGPGRAIHCAVDLRAALQGIGATVRIGLHTGEIELRHDDIGGLTVHIAARVMGEAGAGEVLLSAAVRDLLSGSDITLEDRGVHVLKGVDGQWPLFAVTAL